MRLSSLIARVEDRAIAHAPAAKALAQRTATSARIGFARSLVAVASGATKLAAKAAPKAE